MELLLLTHGVRGMPGVAAAHARWLERETGLRVQVGCLRARPSIEEALDRLEAPGRALPLLFSEGFILDRMRARIHRHRNGRRIRLLPVLGRHPDLAGLVVALGRRAAREAGLEPRASELLLVGHGTRRHPRSGALARAIAVRAAQHGAFARTAAAFLEQPPHLDAHLRAARRPLVAVGLFMDPGPHGRDDVEAALENAPVPVRYAGPVGGSGRLRELLRAAVQPAQVAV